MYTNTIISSVPSIVILNTVFRSL